MKATDKTQVSVLGQNDIVLEYRPDVTPRTEFEQTSDGLRVSAYRAQRLYNDRRWPNPVVIKLTNVEAGLRPPVMISSSASWTSAGGARFEGKAERRGAQRAKTSKSTKTSVSNGQDHSEDPEPPFQPAA